MTAIALHSAPSRSTVFGEQLRSVFLALRKESLAFAGTLVVLDRTRPGEHVAGIVTDRDLVTKVLANNADPRVTTVAEIMTRAVGVCHARDVLFDVVQTMRRLGVRRLPVLDDSNQLLGIVSTDDIHGALARFMDALSQGMLRETLREAEACI